MAGYRGWENFGGQLGDAANLLAQGYKDRLMLEQQARRAQVEDQYKQMQSAVDAAKVGRQEIPRALIPLALNPLAALQGKELPSMDSITPEMIAAGGIESEGDKFYSSASGKDYVEKAMGGMAARGTADLRNQTAQGANVLAEKKFKLAEDQFLVDAYRKLKKKSDIEALTNPEAAAETAALADSIFQRISAKGAPAQAAPAAQPKGPEAAPGYKIGEVRSGYRYKGGNPAEQSSWEAVK